MRAIYIIIAILLGIDNVFIQFKVSGISYDRLLEFLFFFYFLKEYFFEIKNNKFFRNWNNFLIAFAILQLFVNLKLAIIGENEFKDVYTSLFKSISYIVYSFLFLLIAKKNIKYINYILYVHLFICFFAFLQHPISPFASQMLEIKRMLFSPVVSDNLLGNLKTEDAYISGGFADRFRLAGPFNSTINFSYFAISSFILNFYLYLNYKRKLYLLMLIILFVASVLTQTRSLLLAELILVLGYLFFNPAKSHSLYKFSLIISALLLTLFIYAGEDLLINPNSRITKISSEGEGDSRPLLWLTGAYAVMNHPLGITNNQYDQVKKEMYTKYGETGILHLGSHNGIINIGLQYSFIGYILFFFLVILFLRFISYLESDSKIFFRLALVSYLVHTSFHNNFFLNADYPFLMIIMLISIDSFKKKCNNHSPSKVMLK